MAEDLVQPARRRILRRLSVREAHVLEMASLGLTNAEIARRLGISAHGVKFHLSSIYRKLGVHNRTQAAYVFRGAGAGGGPRQ